MKRHVSDKAKGYQARCSCGCGAQMLVQVIDDDAMIDTRLNGRHTWTGVILEKEDRKRLVNLLTIHSPGI